MFVLCLFNKNVDVFVVVPVVEDAVNAVYYYYYYYYLFILTGDMETNETLVSFFCLVFCCC